MVDCNHHPVENEKNTQKLSWALGVIASFMVLEVVGGIISGSLALLADAAHMLTDALALSLALVAQFLSRRPADQRLHFGYRRAQVLAAFTNGILLTILLAWIVIEAVTRFFNPVEVKAPLMFWVAAAGLIANAVAFAILHRNNESDVNMRGAVLHVVGDLLGSVAAIIAAGVIYFTGWLQIDPLLSLVVAGLIGVSAIRLIRETGFILLEGAPEDIDVKELAQKLQHNDALIKDVHDVQISQITPGQLRLTMHLSVDNEHDGIKALASAKSYIAEHYNIEVSTIQVEAGGCPDEKINHAVSSHGGAKLVHNHHESVSASDTSGPASAPVASTL